MLPQLALDPLYMLSGFVVGVIVGLTGVGGGSLMTPILVLLFGVHPATAVGTDLLFATCTKFFGGVVHGAQKSIDWRVVGLLALGSVPASAATLLFLVLSGIHDSGTDAVISIVLGFMLILTALSLVFRNHLPGLIRFGEGLTGRRQATLTVFTGAVLGVLVSISSVGAGAIGVAVLIALYPRLPILKVVGSDIAHAVPLTFVAGMGHWLIGSVHLDMLLSLLAGSIPGILVASALAPRVSERILRFGLAGILTVVGVRLIA